MEPVHVQVLDAARRLAGPDWTFTIAGIVGHLPHLNPGTVRTHVASRCCVTAPSNHASRHPYFRGLVPGVYRIEPPFRHRPGPRHATPSQDRVLALSITGVDTTLIVESLRMTPTERLDTMRRAAQSLEMMRRR